MSLQQDALCTYREKSNAFLFPSGRASTEQGGKRRSCRPLFTRVFMSELHFYVTVLSRIQRERKERLETTKAAERIKSQEEVPRPADKVIKLKAYAEQQHHRLGSRTLQ